MAILSMSQAILRYSGINLTGQKGISGGGVIKMILQHAKRYQRSYAELLGYRLEGSSILTCLWLHCAVSETICHRALPTRARRPNSPQSGVEIGGERPCGVQARPSGPHWVRWLAQPNATDKGVTLTQHEVDCGSKMLLYGYPFLGRSSVGVAVLRAKCSRATDQPRGFGR